MTTLTSTPTALRAVGIVRVSQIEDGAQSPETQARSIIERCLREGWTLDPDDILDENVLGNGNVSGGAGLDHRPGLGPAVAMVERGEAQVIVAAHLDRLFRDLDLQREVIGRVEAAGGRIEAVDFGHVSHETPMGELHATMDGAFAQYMRKTSRKRSMDAVTQAIEQGKVPWHQTSPGYVRSEDSKLSPDPDIVPVIVKAFEMRDGGSTIASVRKHLAAHGIVKSYHGTMHLLRDRIYLGEIHFKDRRNLTAHDAIVDRDLFKRVQNVSVPRGAAPKSERLLARLDVLRCSGCGGRMVVGTQTQNGRSYPFYRCGHVREDCAKRVTISAELVERVVVDAVREHLADAEGRASAEQNVRLAVHALDVAQADLDAAFRAFSGFEGEAAAIKRLAELRALRDDAQAHVDRLGGVRSAVTVNASADWNDLSLGGRRDLVRATVESVTVAPGRGAGRISLQLVG